MGFFHKNMTILKFCELKRELEMQKKSCFLVLPCKSTFINMLKLNKIVQTSFGDA